VDSAQGVYLEPIMDDTLAPSDSITGGNNAKGSRAGKGGRGNDIAPRPKPKHPKGSCVDSVAALKADSTRKADSIAGKPLVPIIAPATPPARTPGEPIDVDSVPIAPPPAPPRAKP
jgi:hypothetical protein